MKLQGLYDPVFEHDACGIGFVVNMDGTRSHELIEEGITILNNLEHRGAVGSDQKSGDGAGMMLQIPHGFFKKSLDFKLPQPGQYGVGFLFLPSEKPALEQAKGMIAETCREEGFNLLGWRPVPHNTECLGEVARMSIPALWQVFLGCDSHPEAPKLELKLFVLRKCLENKAVSAGWDMNNFYIASLSAFTVVYKGMFVSEQFTRFYPDLSDRDFQSAMVMVHQRYSTNTFPSWPLAQPFRFVAHNGEINTLRGNVNKLRDRDKTLSSSFFGEDIEKIFPILNANASDSASFDNVFELLVRSGRTMEHVMMMMVPEAFGFDYHISQDKRAFYEYHMTIMDPWDGPAALMFTDGRKIGAYLDRNGLRPGRYVITRSGKMILASETGVLDIDPTDIREKGRLAPGKMIVVDTEAGRVIRDNEIKAMVSRWKPYRRWLQENKIELKGLFQVPVDTGVQKERLRERQLAFGYTEEDLRMLILPMVQNSQEPVGSMGNDAAPAVLSEKPQRLYNYFKQRFAQVTNPPIDPYRESLVMSLSSWVGRQRNLLEETPLHCRQLKLSQPLLTNDDLERLRNSNIDDFRVCTVPMLYEAREGGLEKGLVMLGLTVEQKVDEGYSMVILSDRGLNPKNAAIPALLATSTVHHHLVRRTKRHLIALVLETGEAREVHHFAMLISYGASGVCPYLVFESIRQLKEEGYLDPQMMLSTAYLNYITAVNKGLLKVMSKMGISTLRSYRHAQTFEAVGLSEVFVNRYFPGTPSRLGGIHIDIIEQESLFVHNAAFRISENTSATLASNGQYHYRKTGELHYLSPEAIVFLQYAVREGDYEQFKRYSREINGLATIRSLLTFKTSDSVPLNEVEPEEQIVKRFVTSAMSFGSISKEAHETMAIAMNRLGGASNSGEGGEDEERYLSSGNGDSRRSRIKQIASARFGVNSHYLVNADELQIKMAQGAKPGEGGQLPGHKVDAIIAKVRHSTPGVMLISPPPHHDIYSIEDLAQLIHDLRCGNPHARISVKLVSEMGVGTIAAGVAKAGADMVLISGNDGGTGASPWSSIKHAGSPWEIGLAETQQILVINGLRDRIRIQVDGQLKTPRDVIIAALLGAEEFGFGTLPLVSMGCIMMRKCHLNTCPVGVATQDPELRKRFRGEPDHVINFMNFIARGVREYMAQLGCRSFDEMVGRTDLLIRDDSKGHFKTKGIDFSKFFHVPDELSKSSLCCISGQDRDRDNRMDKELISEAVDALEHRRPITSKKAIRIRNRSVGATLSAEVSRRFGSKGLPEDTIAVDFTGSAGQSFGAFLAHGITFRLEGDANDYVGKGLSGGKIIIKPPRKATFQAHKNSITGNVNLFGATAGEAYINGLAGERFCVRNSGALAVVEGVGDHGCEYMTGGRVIILGPTGVNFAAGMSGGIAYILDESQLFDTRCNLEMVDIESALPEDDISFLKSMLQKHFDYTGSSRAKSILENWEEFLPSFIRVVPVEYRKALERIEEKRYEETGTIGMTEEVFA